MKIGTKTALAGFAAFFITFTLSAPETSQWHFSQWSAAWIQAIGSIIAILVAIYVPTKLELSKQKREQEERKRIEAAAHFILIRELTGIINYCSSRIVAIDISGLDAPQALDALNIPGLMTKSERNKIFGIEDERLAFFLSLNKEVMEKYNILLVNLNIADMAFFNSFVCKGDGCKTEEEFSEVKEKYNEVIKRCNALSCEK
ncbi:hypothetical protein [Halomonas citrativorans]|uniref:Uncharacterized protein n=1 Tax=Halomonas citrativorans TaxID=2742612 RepID=A0ABR9FG15_9GAMM|nr:hypothetical protein [Halomonas citrativorans]MBE0405264.1 hypothetical protein [Halomonas citrativorans]